MDQQQLAGMDPKLREAYERIMGMAVQPKTPLNTPPQNSNPAQPPIPQATSVNLPGDTMPQAAPTGPHADQINTPPQPANTPSPDSSIPHPMPEAVTPNTPQPASSSHSDPQPQHTPPSYDPVLASDQIHTYIADEVKGAKRSIQMIQLIYLVGGLAFLVFYILFWMKVFSIPSPF